MKSPETPAGEERLVRFRPGMSATVEVFTETVFDAVAVPIQAVTVRDLADSLTSGDSDAGIEPREELREVVFVVEDGKADRREVTTGISDDTHIELRTGLSPGESVVTGPYSAVSRELSDGMQVRTGSVR